MFYGRYTLGEFPLLVVAAVVALLDSAGFKVQILDAARLVFAVLKRRKN